MEVAVPWWVTLSLVLGSIIVRWAWSVLDPLWLKPKRLERCLREQGLQGNSYRFIYGDVKENNAMVKEATYKPMSLSNSHDITPRFIPFLVQTVKTYGKNCFMWYGPVPRVIVMNPEDMKDVFKKFDDFRKIKPNAQVKLLVRGIVRYEGEKWVKHRRILNPSFRLEKIKKMLPAFHESCDEMIKKWESLLASKEGSSCVLDVWPAMQNLTANVISRTAFGSSYEEGRKIFELLKEQLVLVIETSQMMYIPGWRYLPTKMTRRINEIYKEINCLVEGMIIKREKVIEASEATKDDLLGALMGSYENGKRNKNDGMSIEDVIEECKLFYLGGQETTAGLLVWTMILLGQNQKWQDRARDEVLQVFGSNKPDFDRLTHLKVVTMILLEVLRLYPSQPLLSRAVHKKTQLGKFTLPAGVEVALPTLLIHRDKELWGNDADEFKPERFSEGVSNATKSPVSYFPFGAGPRICIGQNFSMTEAKLAVALILQHFTFELSPSYVHAPSSPMIQPLHGAPIILHKR